MSHVQLSVVYNILSCIYPVVYLFLSEYPFYMFSDIYISLYFHVAIFIIFVFMDEIKVPHLRSTAVINLSLGTQFIAQIQGSLHYMTESMTAEDKEQFTARVESGVQSLEGRDLVIYILSVLSMNI